MDIAGRQNFLLRSMRKSGKESCGTYQRKASEKGAFNLPFFVV
nr:MAG TPA: hypothetical protein [Caudoviricetes sp.]